MFIKGYIYWLLLSLFFFCPHNAAFADNETPLEKHRSKYGKGALNMSITNTPQPQTIETELERLKKEKEKWEAEKAAIDAEKNYLTSKQELLKARLGLSGASPAATVPAGDIKAADEKLRFIETKILAETAAHRAAKKLTKKLEESSPAIKTLVIGNTLGIDGVYHYRAIYAQIEVLEKSYAEHINSSKDLKMRSEQAIKRAEGILSKMITPQFVSLATLGVVTTGIRTFADLINLFRTDVTYSIQDVTISDEHIVAFLMSELTAKYTIYFPQQYPIFLTPSPLLDMLKVLQQHNQKAQQLLQQMDGDIKIIQSSLQLLQNKIDDLKKVTPSSSNNEMIKEMESVQHELRKLMAAYHDLAADKAAYESLLKELPVVDQQNKQTLMAALLRAESLSNVLSQNDTYVLKFVTTAGGQTRIGKNLFWNAMPTHSAGATINALLFDRTGRLAKTYSVDDYIEYTKPKAIREKLGFDPLSR